MIYNHRRISASGPVGHCTSRFKRAVCVSCRPRVDVHKGGPAYVDACGQREGGHKPDSFYGRRKWMAPYTLRFPPVLVQFPPYSASSPHFQMFFCSYTKFSPPTKMLHFLPLKLTKPFVSPLNDKFPPSNGNDEDFCFIPPIWDGPPGLYKS